jgi:arginine decarboxylase
MKIQISSATGEAFTELAAFDAALHVAGVDNYNLIRLSSVIPPKSFVEVCKGPVSRLDSVWGDKRYVVLAEYRQSIKGKDAWAGIGWVQDSEDGRGLFVEHEADNREQVEADIRASLTDLMKTRGVDFGKIKMKVTGVTCVDKPVCALVVAQYEQEGWKGSNR